MKILSLLSMLTLAANANDYVSPKFPDDPSPAVVLEANKLKDADETTLLRFVESHSNSVGFSLAEIREQEVKSITAEYFERIQKQNGNAEEYLTMAISKLQQERLCDPRRIVDASLRELGQRGTGISLSGLISLSESDERNWVNWKALASIEEILTRIDPTQLDDRSLMALNAPIIAPLLRDLDLDIADHWAWALWNHHKEWLMASYRDEVPLLTRILLAGAFARSHPSEATEVFDEGLKSRDPALRTTAEMMIRSGIGGSLPYESSAEKLLQVSRTGKWISNIPTWEVLPLPLDQPLLRKNWGGRRDLIWVDRKANIKKQIEDVCPELEHSLPNGLFYSNGNSLRLLDKEGRIHTRFQKQRWSSSSLSSTGGLFAFTKCNRVAEYLPDGSQVWECQISSPGGYREIAAIGGGRVVLLGYRSMECRNRRGDLQWKTSLEKLDDPREIMPVSENRFLLSCTKSIGWLTADGAYEPILTELGSTGEILYHPTEPWIIMDGATNTAIIYDPVSRRETGRFDLDDGGTEAKSRFLTPTGQISE